MEEGRLEGPGGNVSKGSSLLEHIFLPPQNKVFHRRRGVGTGRVSISVGQKSHLQRTLPSFRVAEPFRDLPGGFPDVMIRVSVPVGTPSKCWKHKCRSQAKSLNGSRRDTLPLQSVPYW